MSTTSHGLGSAFWWLGTPWNPTCSMLRAHNMRTSASLIMHRVSAIQRCVKMSQSTLRYQAPGIRNDRILDLRLRRGRGFSTCLFKYPCACFQILKKKRKNALVSIIFTSNQFKTLQSWQWYYSNIPWIHYIKHEILSLNNVCFSFQCF